MKSTQNICLQGVVMNGKSKLVINGKEIELPQNGEQTNISVEGSSVTVKHTNGNSTTTIVQNGGGQSFQFVGATIFGDVVINNS